MPRLAGCSQSLVSHTKPPKLPGTNQLANSQIRQVGMRKPAKLVAKASDQTKRHPVSIDMQPESKSATTSTSILETNNDEELIPIMMAGESGSCTDLTEMHDRHCNCPACSDPCSRGLLGFQPFDTWCSQWQCSWHLMMARWQTEKSQINHNLNEKSRRIHQHLHQNKLSEWAAKKREQANAPPWPRFHPLPTRNVFYPEDLSETPKPTEQYGQFGVAK